jgi:hypothetical protein
MSPLRSIDRIVRRLLRNLSSWSINVSVPACRAASHICAASVLFIAMGFSQSTDLPFSSADNVISR